MKKELPKQELTPVTLRLILSLVLALIIVAHIGITLLGQKFLKENSGGVTEVITTAKSTEEALRQLQNAKAVLAQKAKTVEASRHLVGQVKEASYQKEVIYDLIAYGKKVGIGVNGFTFTGAEGAGGAASSGSSVAGVTSHNVTVDFASPADYRAFLKLLKYLEGNLTQVHLKSLSVAPPAGDMDKNSIATPSLSLEIFTK